MRCRCLPFLTHGIEQYFGQSNLSDAPREGEWQHPSLEVRRPGVPLTLPRTDCVAWINASVPRLSPSGKWDHKASGFL